MADPLSISAGIVGIVVPALHGARLLLNDINKIANAPHEVKRLRGEVNSISESLGLLKGIEGPVWTSLGTAIHDQSRDTIKGCEEACDTIRADIQRWTKRSKGGKLSWLDRINVGILRDHQLKAHSDLLRTYGIRFTSTVGTATLYASLRNSQMTSELRNSITQQRGRIAAASGDTETDLVAVQRTLTEIQSLSINDPVADTGADVDDDGDRDTTVTSLEELTEALRQSQALLRELLSKCEPQTARSKKESGGSKFSFGDNYRGMQIGISNGSVVWNSE